MTDAASPSVFTYHMPGEFIDSGFNAVPAYPMGGGPDLANAMQPNCEVDQQTPLQIDADIDTEAETETRRETESETQSKTDTSTEALPSAEGLLLKNSLALFSNNPYHVSFADDSVDNAVPDGFQEQLTNDYTHTTPQAAMAAAFDVSTFAPFSFGDNDTGININNININDNDNDTTGRPSISLSSCTRTSNASYDTTSTIATTATTTTATTVAAPTPYDYSIFSGSYTSLLSANSDSISNSSSNSLVFQGQADSLFDEAVEDSDDSHLPSPSLFRNKDGSLGVEGLTDTTAAKEIDDAVQWTDVAVPAALFETPVLTGLDAETAPDLLQAILQSSVESIQSQVPLLKAAVSSLKEDRAEQQRQEEEKLRDTAKGKEKEDMTASTATLRPPPMATTTLPAQPSAQPKMSKRQMFASKLKRLRGNGSAGNGESSSQGAAAAAAAAAAMQRHNLMMARRSATPGFKWVRSEHGQQWQLVPDAVEGADHESVAAGSSAVAVRTEPGMAPISEGRRKTMLLAMVKQDKDKKKDAVPPQTMQVHPECISCFEDIPTKQAVKTVCHSYCVDCFAQLVSTAVANEAQFPPKCCLNEIPSKTVAKYAPRDVARLYALKKDEYAIPVADRVYCPTVDCGVFVPKNQVSAAARTAHCRNGHETCTACRQPTHGRNNREACPEASAQDRRDQQLADNLAAEEGWRRCISCAVIIEHREACQHMTCRCGAEFCYVCGAHWRTCNCTMEDLHALKDGAQGRRQARVSREQHEQELVEQADRELAEVRDALRQVEEFERQETARLAAERAVQRQRLQVLKQQREAMLRIETESKYAALRSSLLGLTDAQLHKARQVRRSERVAQHAAHMQERRQLAQKQADERAADEAVAAETIRKGEAFWQADYRARLVLEARLEALYAGKMKINDRAHGSASDTKEHRKAFKQYQKQNDERLDVYLTWRDRELAQMRFVAEEARDVRSEVLDSLQRKHRRTQRAEARALAQKHRAERVWCSLVKAERERLLAEAEEVEQGFGLAGSTSETDTALLALLEVDAVGGFDRPSSAAGAEAGTGDESNHMYAVILDAIAGQMDGQLDGFEYWGASSATEAREVRDAADSDDWEDARDFYSDISNSSASAAVAA
ncbi:ibr domain-containing protein [Ophiostoma piceae UAMH 11346]|uniref:RBR-type E3 ubiquitin transferase n=1 Tax=Ophiostoma piceae (strain UAMH 11346) TaxID=1262450 RepID=S3CU18_OPHP1|nr:ibr domain-containing protein [Ophiostoma piceae UAMH 11346]